MRVFIQNSELTFYLSFVSCNCAVHECVLCVGTAVSLKAYHRDINRRREDQASLFCTMLVIINKR